MGVASLLYNSQGEIVGAIESVRDISERKKYEVALKASLDEKSVMLMEIHHRVKNNLQIITGLIRLQARQITNEQALAALRECETRVLTIALVHESLYQSGNLANINAKRHITNLASTILMSENGRENIMMDIDVDDLPLDMNTAIPASLIINELMTNSLKYAFSGRDRGTIRIGLHREPGNMLALTIADDGRGLPAGMDISKTLSLGLRLVMRLVQDQLSGDLRILPDKGTSFLIRFPAAPETAAATDAGKGRNITG
jgi:two-component sensor histidine kinase